MYTALVIRNFSSAHCLREYKGKCEAVHGHNWKVEITVGSETLDELGMVYDFSVLKQKADQLLDTFDHVFLNDVPPFDQVNPSSENIARVIYERMSEVVNDDRVTVLLVSVWESDNSKATYTFAT